MAPELKPTAARNCEKILRDLAMEYPGAQETFPWGHTVIKVQNKSFVFLGTSDDSFSLSVKLPHSADSALSLPFASPTEYGLGKSGWVTARFGLSERPPLELLRRWMDESYRAIAPKKRLAELDASDKKKAPASPKPRSIRKKPASKAR